MLRTERPTTTSVLQTIQGVMAVRVEIVIGPGALEELAAALDTFWSTNNHVPAAIRMQVGIAVAEVAANIIEHGDARWLRVAMHVGLSQVHVDFNDDGAPPAIELASVVMPDELAERGRGLALAKAALGLFSYHRDQFGNHWRMISQAFRGPGDGGVD